MLNILVLDYNIFLSLTSILFLFQMFDIRNSQTKNISAVKSLDQPYEYNFESQSEEIELTDIFKFGKILGQLGRFLA